MDYFFNQKIAKNMAFLLNTIFLCMHIFFFLFLATIMLELWQILIYSA